MARVGTWVAVFFIAASALTYMVLDRLLSVSWAYLGLVNTHLLGEGFTVTSAISLTVAVVAGLVTWRHRTVNGLSREVVQELFKVTWPSWPETKASTTVVIIFSFIMAGILGTFDYFFAAISDGFFKVTSAF